jgi:hypothetical protein
VNLQTWHLNGFLDSSFKYVSSFMW